MPATVYRQQFVPAGYDIIGDIHGCANTLEVLLRKLGYQFIDGCYRHSERQAVFLGDIIDRGPHICEAVNIVKNMVEAGTAQCVMGNHEYNAIAYSTVVGHSASGEPEYLRAHTPRHNRLIAETLEQFSPYPERWRELLEWFKTLPLFLELPGFRVVHACWDNALIQQFKQRYGGNRVSEQFLLASADKSSFAGRFMDRLTRGTDLNLPDGLAINGRDGYVRQSFRTKFWAHAPRTYRDVVFQPDPLPETIADRPLAEFERDSLLCYGEDEPPVFVGHYWLHGKPRVLRPNVACLDYSAVKFGRLVAYRYDGESVLNDDKFRWVYVDP